MHGTLTVGELVRGATSRRIAMKNRGICLDSDCRTADAERIFHALAKAVGS